jgi:hypothetical protein
MLPVDQEQRHQKVILSPSRDSADHNLRLVGIGLERPERAATGDRHRHLANVNPNDDGTS